MEAAWHGHACLMTKKPNKLTVNIHNIQEATRANCRPYFPYSKWFVGYFHTKAIFIQNTNWIEEPFSLESIRELTTCFHEFSKYKSTNFFTNISQLKNSLLVIIFCRQNSCLENSWKLDLLTSSSYPLWSFLTCWSAMSYFGEFKGSSKFIRWKTWIKKRIKHKIIYTNSSVN